tara:strand:- start:460 stop:594 length:135 start_codon:yes stop_codon:yes gene_type:complete
MSTIDNPSEHSGIITVLWSAAEKYTIMPVWRLNYNLQNIKLFFV